MLVIIISIHLMLIVDLILLITIIVIAIFMMIKSQYRLRLLISKLLLLIIDHFINTIHASMLLLCCMKLISFIINSMYLSMVRPGALMEVLKCFQAHDISLTYIGIYDMQQLF